jgi:hypothetical protein
MFTGHGVTVEAAKGLINIFGGDNPYIRAYILIMIGYTLMSVLFYMIHRIFETEWMSDIRVRMNENIKRLHGGGKKKEERNLKTDH